MKNVDLKNMEEGENANLKIDNIISSDLKRAYMTAQIINKNFNKNLKQFNSKTKVTNSQFCIVESHVYNMLDFYFG